MNLMWKNLPWPEIHRSRRTQGIMTGVDEEGETYRKTVGECEIEVGRHKHARDETVLLCVLQGTDAPIPKCCLLYPWKDGSLSSASSALSGRHSSELPVVSAWSGRWFRSLSVFLLLLSEHTHTSSVARTASHCPSILNLLTCPLLLLLLSLSHALSHHCSITDTVREWSSTTRLLPHPLSLSLSPSSVWVSLSVCFWVTGGPHSGKEKERVQSN